MFNKSFCARLIMPKRISISKELKQRVVNAHLKGTKQVAISRRFVLPGYSLSKIIIMTFREPAEIGKAEKKNNVDVPRIIKFQKLWLAKLFTRRSAKSHLFRQELVESLGFNLHAKAFILGSFIRFYSVMKRVVIFLFLIE